MALPKAILLDLDDTILNDSGQVDECWRETCLQHAADVPVHGPIAVLQAIERTNRWYWSDSDRHRLGRLDLAAARRDVVSLALADLGVDDTNLACRMADTYGRRRDAALELFPDSVATLQWLRDHGCRLALLTNGGASSQRAKIERFGLQPFFDVLLIEGELGFGKPDPRIYELALRQLSVPPAEAWMVGDNLEWDVSQPQKMGLFAIWVDIRGKGLPEDSAVCPDHMVRALPDLRALVGR